MCVCVFGGMNADSSICTHIVDGGDQQHDDANDVKNKDARQED